MNSLKIAIIDYGMGNIRSIENALNHIGEFEIIVTDEHNEIKAADCLILPGVGAFPDAMKQLNENNLIDVLNHQVLIEKKPVLGICLGMQLLFDSSEEISFTPGLCFIPGKVKYMKPGQDLRVPHIGWNSLELLNEPNLFSFLKSDKDFYFVHSLYAECEDEYKLANFEYGVHMTAAVRNDNVFGMQFHPEKSQANGLRALRYFMKWVSDSQKELCQDA